MSGIVILMALSLWIGIVLLVSRFMTRRMCHGEIKTKVAVVVFALIFIAPVTDEIVGGFQFRAMCTVEMEVNIDFC